MKKLQLRHHDEIFDSRSLALEFFKNITDSSHVDSISFGTSLYAEPMVVKYKDNEGNAQILLAIGVENGDNKPYHIIDSADIIEKITSNQYKISALTETNTKLDRKINFVINGVKDIKEDLLTEINNNKVTVEKIEPTEENVFEEYVFIDGKGDPLGETIKVYKDNTFIGAKVGYKGAISVVQKEDGSFEFTYEENSDKDVEYLYLIYRNEKGMLDFAALDFESFLMEAEFGDGLKVENHVASIKLNKDEEYLRVDKENGLYTVGIDDAIINAVEKASKNINAKIDEEVKKSNDTDENIKTLISEFSAATVANITSANTLIVEEQKRALSQENLLNDSILSLSGAIDTERNEREREDKKINSEIISNQISSKDLVVDKTSGGTLLTLQTDEVTITKMANAGTIYDTNVAVLGTLLQMKNVRPSSPNIKSRYELQGAGGKLIGDPIEIMVESALIDVRQGKEGDKIDSTNGKYISYGTGDATMNFVYRYNTGIYELVQILVSKYFTDAHFGRGLKNDNGVVSLAEGIGNEYLVINDDTIAVTGVNNSIRIAKEEAISKATNDSIEYTNLIASGINTNISTIQDSVKESLEILTNSYTDLINTDISLINTRIDKLFNEDLKIQSGLNTEIILREDDVKDLKKQIKDSEKNVIESAITEATNVAISTAKEEVARVLEQGGVLDKDTLESIKAILESLGDNGIDFNNFIMHKDINSGDTSLIDYDETNKQYFVSNDANQLIINETDWENLSGNTGVDKTLISYLIEQRKMINTLSDTVQVLQGKIDDSSKVDSGTVRKIIEEYILGYPNEIKVGVSGDTDDKHFVIRFDDNAIFG